MPSRTRLLITAALSMLTVLLLSILAACTAGDAGPLEEGSTPAAGSGAEEAGPGLEAALAGIPFPSEDSPERLAAVAEHHQCPGDGEWMHGPGSVDVAAPFAAHRLPAGPWELEWAIYRMSTGGFPALEASVGAYLYDSEYYVGIADFDRATWHFSGPTDEPLCTRTLQERNVSAGGFVYLVVVAYDSAQVDVRFVDLVTDSPGWSITTIDSGEMQAIGVQVFYYDPQDLLGVGLINDARATYYRAETATPSGAADWTKMNVYSAIGPAVLWTPFEAQFISGRPAMVYYEYDESYQMQYSRTFNAEPDEGEWTTVAVGDPLTPPDLPGKQLGFCQFQHTPRILLKDGALDEVVLASSPVALPNADDWTFASVAADVCRPSLVDLNGRLACCYVPKQVGGLMQYARALVDSPSGPADWSVIETSASFGYVFEMMTKLVPQPYAGVEYSPFVTYLPSGHASPQVLSAFEIEPGGPTDWHHTVPEVVTDVGTYKLDAAEIAGRMAILYYLQDAGKLQYARAQYLTIDESEDWEITTIVSSTTIGSISLAEVENVPVIVFWDYGAGLLKYAHLD